MTDKKLKAFTDVLKRLEKDFDDEMLSMTAERAKAKAEDKTIYYHNSSTIKFSYTTTPYTYNYTVHLYRTSMQDEDANEVKVS